MRMSSGEGTRSANTFEATALLPQAAAAAVAVVGVSVGAVAAVSRGSVLHRRPAPLSRLAVSGGFVPFPLPLFIASRCASNRRHRAIRE